ncbi:MAG: pyrrolo-quinoline quinone, partial [Planctomycetales bacterium]|nr:pyrrolo-quinoline quinone [Planctomycetales bacterium]
MCKRLLMLVTSVCGAMLANITIADDWPQWMGPQRDDVYREEGVVDRIPAQGLPIQWRAPVASGYAGPAV